jgi:autotransporter-associated beta strand protein
MGSSGINAQATVFARRLFAAFAFAVALAPLTAAQAQVTLTEVSRFNLDSIVSATNTDGSLNGRYVGNQVNSVGWNGSRLFVAGFISTSLGGDFDNQGIIEIANASATGVVTSGNVQYGSRFGFYPGVNSRGYTGLSLSGNRVYASLDLGTAYPASVAPGMAGYDVSGTTPAQLWALNNVRGSVHVATDPGYVVSGASQGGAGVAWGTFGTGSTSRILSNADTGAYIYTGTATGTTAQGLQWRLPSPTMPQFSRSLSFDPDTGDIYGRTGNWVTKAVRTGTNSADTPIALWNTYTGTNVLGQNLAFMSNTTNGDLVVFNERSDASYPQTFTQAVNLIDSSGAAQSVSWNFLTGTSSGYTTVTKSGWYDFAFDPVTQTLAVAQPQEYRVSIFKLGSPAPSTQLRWAPTDGYTLSGDGTWDNSPATVWNGAYGPEAWNSGAQAYFGGTTYPTSAVTVDAGGVSVGRGMSFVANGYTIAGGSIALTGSTASVNNVYVDPAVTATVNSSIAATNGLAKSGGGTLVIGGTITGGNLSINNGTVTVAPTGVIQTSPGISILASGTLDVTQLTGGYVVPGGQSLAGAGLVNGSVTMSAGATLSPGSNLGTLTIANDLTLNGGGNYNWQILSGSGSAGTSWDLARIGGALSIASTSTSPFKINLWSLSGTGPDVNGNATNFDSTQNYTWTIVTATGGITGFASDNFLINTSGTNGTTGFANAFGNGTFSLAQSGNDLNLVFTAGGPTVITINVASGTQTQTQAGYVTLSGSVPVVKTGAGTLVVDQANTLTGSTTVQGGRLQLANGSALSSSRIVPVAGGTITMSQGLQTTVGGLAANAGGLTDVGTGMMTVASGLSTADMLVALGTGRGDGTWNGTSGITSSAAAADLAGSIPRTVGWLDNGDGSVTFAYAAPGDTNLDWSVDILDAANFLAGGKFDSGTPATWNEGDFGYDGVVDILDAADFLSTGLFDAGPYNAAPGSVAAVPEPSGLAWLAAAAACGAWIRRRSAGTVTP